MADAALKSAEMSAIASIKVANYAVKAGKKFKKHCQKAAAIKAANDARKANEAVIIAFKRAALRSRFGNY